METLLSYLVETNLFWIALYACHALFLRRQTFLHWNRAYLLGSLLAAFALPLVQYPEAAPPVPVVYEVTAAAFTVVALPAPSLLTWENLLWLVYGVGVLVMLVRLARQFGCLYFLVKSGESIEMKDHTLVLLDDDKVGSFSFLRWVVISRADYEDNFDTILNHELAHVRQRHSWDILGVEVLRVVFWFNPVLVLYKNALQQVHEYLADRQSVLAQAQVENRDRYAEFLVSYAMGGSAAVLTNPFFNPKLLKNRIAMLYKNKNSKWSLGKYVAVALLIGFASLVVASCERDSLPSTKGESEKQVYELVDVQGIVKGEDGRPLPGASVGVKGATRGTTTDSEGRFKMNVPAGSKLQVKFEGLRSIDLAISPTYKSTKFSITLNPQSARYEEELDPHVVAAPSKDGKSVNLTVQPATINGESIFTVVEQHPEFPGGIEALRKFLEKNLQYPAAARRAKVQGKVFLNFVVTKEGEIKDVTIIKGMGFGLDEEALRVMSLMPRWAPGKQDGKAINVRYNLPIAFELGKAPELKTNEESKKLGMQGVPPDSEIERVTGSKPTKPEDSDQMLLVVDGKIVSDRSEKPELDPAAVESINIMKDAAAIKKYGDKGKNGAIEVILKKGKS